MNINNTLRQNIEYLLNSYKRSLNELENKDKLSDEEFVKMELYASYIVELETALEMERM